MMAGPFKFKESDIEAGRLGTYRVRDGFVIRHPFTADQMAIDEGDEMVIVGIEEGLKKEDPTLLAFCHVKSHYKVCLTVDELKKRLEPTFKA